MDLEELLGGRVLAWVGAMAVLVGIFFLLVIAVSNGWIGETPRTVMALLASLGLLLGGMRLHERRGRTEASLAAAATGIAGLFGSIAVAGAVYDLDPGLLALAGALVVGGTATALALRWQAPGIGALGILGTLAGPALVGAQPSGEAVALLAVALASATAVLLWQRWNWLAFAAFAITTPQWLWFLAESRPSATTVATLVAFGALNAAAAVGFEVRSAARTLRISSTVLLLLNALVLAGIGWSVLSETVSDTAGHTWLIALAAAHAAVGLAGGRSRRISNELSLVALAIAIVLGDIAFASIADGLPLVLGWVASGGAFAALAARGLSRRGDQPFALAGLGGHLLLALAHALVIDAPPGADAPGAEGMLALAAVAAGCGVSARLAPRARVALDAAGLAIVAYLTTVAFDGPALTAAFAAEAAALGTLARRTRDEVATCGAAAFLLAGLLHALAFLASPEALLTGLDRPLEAALGLGAVLGATIVLARLFHGVAPKGDDRAGRASAFLTAGAAGLALYLASVELVTPFQPDGAYAGLAIAELGVRQQGQALLSALWTIAGVAALLAGLVRDLPALRKGALALLVVAVAKVFVYDLAALTSIYRVASFIVLGLLLLGAAFAWQRVRPRPLPDLRGVPQGLR